MQLSTEPIPNGLRLLVDGPLDHASEPELRPHLLRAASGDVALDLARCPFISSAGLRLILEGHKAAKAAGKEFQLLNVTPGLEKILETTGFSQMVRYTVAHREIPFAGLELLSAGACGECYRLDRERVVKLYFPGMAGEIVEREKKFAREAFILGVPTAISYEIVRCDGRLGVIYEMLDAELFSRVMLGDLNNLDTHARTLAEVAQAIHAIPGSRDVFPDAKSHFRNYLQALENDLPAEDIEHLRQRLDEIPDSGQCVHLDLHTSNIMIRDGNPLIIDMGEFSVGSYLFDLGQWCTIYGYPELNTCEVVTHIPSDQGREFLEKLLDFYFTRRTPEERATFERNRHFLASLRTIGAAALVPALREPLVKQLRDFMLPRIRAELNSPTVADSVVLPAPVRLDAYSSKAFGEECEQTLEHTHARFVLLDLWQTIYLSSAGLRVFVALGKKLERQQGRLLLCRLTPYCSEVLEISGLKHLFGVFDSLEQAQNVIRPAATDIGSDSLHAATWEDARARVRVMPGDANADGAVEIIGNVAEVLRADMTEQSVVSKSFHETEFSIGCGALGDALEDYFPIMGEMMTIGGTMVWLPTDGHNTPDFLIPKGDSRRVTIRTGFNASIAGGFDELFLVTAREAEGLTVENLYRSVFEHAKAHRPRFRGVVGLAGRVEFAAVYGAGIKRSPIRRFRPVNGHTILHPSNLADWFSGDHEPRLRHVTGLMCGIGVDLTADLGAFHPRHLDLAFYRHPDNTAGKPHLLHNHAVFFSALPWNTDPGSLTSEIAAVVEKGDFCDMRHLLDQSLISRALLGISYTQRITPMGPT